MVPRRQAVRARPGDARDARERGLRRDAALRGVRARQGRRAHRRAVLLRLRVQAAVHALRRRRPRGCGRATSSAIDLPGPRLPHDMAITEKHSILMDLPLYNDPEAATARPLQALLRPRHAEPLRRDPALRRSGEIRWFEAAPCFIYHSVNAWEEGDEVVLDVCRVKQPEPRIGPRRPARERALLPAARRALAPLPVQPAHRPHARADARRRQQRVPVDQHRTCWARRRATPTRCTSRRRRRCCSTG